MERSLLHKYWTCRIYKSPKIVLAYMVILSVNIVYRIKFNMIFQCHISNLNTRVFLTSLMPHDSMSDLSHSYSPWRLAANLEACYYLIAFYNIPTLINISKYMWCPSWHVFERFLNKIFIWSLGISWIYF